MTRLDAIAAQSGRRIRQPLDWPQNGAGQQIVWNRANVEFPLREVLRGEYSIAAMNYISCGSHCMIRIS